MFRILTTPATSSRSTWPRAAIRGGADRPDAVQALADTFSALGDPTRVRILDALSHGELCVCDLAAVLKLSPIGGLASAAPAARPAARAPAP